jgi:TolB-like protein/DNA-binding CsgD family transcriptional regulator
MIAWGGIFERCGAFVATPLASDRPPVSPADLGLSGKQVEVLALLMQGMPNKAICRALDLAEPTVKYHVTTILKALKVANRTEAVLAIGKLGWKLPPASENKRSTESGAAGEAPAGNTDRAPPARVLTEAPKVVGQPVGELKSALALPDKPSIVVLPFTNLSGDPSQDYFVDGMVEDITIALGRLPWLFVIGSSSALTYKNRAVDLRQVGSELGVRYALMGSVRKENNRVRITSQLADTSHGGQIWADSFEEELNNIFDLQDRVAAQVRTMISPALRSEEIERARQKPTENLTAYDLYLRALPIHRASFAQNQEALRLLYRAIELDPAYGAAYGLAAWCYDLQKLFGWILPSDPQIKEGIRVAHLAAEAGKNDSEALWMAAHALVLLAGEPELARPLIDRAISLNPNSPNAWWVSGTVHNHLAEYEIALEHLARARRLSPLEPLAFAHWLATAVGHFLAGRFREAMDAADRSLSEHADFPAALRYKIASCGLLGRIDEGRDYVERLLRVNPGATVTTLKAYYEPMMRRHPRSLDTYLNGLRLSGLPEGEPS